MQTLTVHGHVVPKLGLGTWLLGEAEARRAVEHALALGYRHLDTAQAYDNEAAVGAGLRASGVPREEVFLTTKVWRDHLAAADLARTAEESLRRLGTDYVDLLLVHWPNPAVPLAETLDALAAVREAGRARLIGVSNFPPALLEAALARVPDLACNQVEYHPFLAQDRLLALARRHGLVLTAYSPLARGRVLRDATLRAIAEAHGASPAQVALAWLLAQDRVAAIPKASSDAHREANWAAQTLALTDDERARIDGLAAGRRLVDPDFAPDWDAGA